MRLDLAVMLACILDKNEVIRESTGTILNLQDKKWTCMDEELEAQDRKLH